MKKFTPFTAGVDNQKLPGAGVKHLLINTIDNGRTDRVIKTTMRLLEASRFENLLVDSCGYYLYTAEENGGKISHNPSEPARKNGNNINLAPIHVVNAAAKTRATEVIGLDFPLKGRIPTNGQDKEFRRKKKINIRWAKETVELHQKLCPDIGLLIPFQCYTLAQQDECLHELRGLSFYGVALPTRDLTPMQLGLFLHRFYQVGIRRVHLLGDTSFLRMALFAYFARHFFKKTSVDSTTWLKRAINSTYWNPHNLSGIVINAETEIDPSIKMDCHCAHCSGRTFSDVKHIPFTDRVFFLLNHNHEAISRMAAQLYKHSKSIRDLENFIVSRATENQRQKQGRDELEDVIMTLSVIEALKDEDTRVLDKLLIH
jgi:hypothetical protein